MKVHLLMLVLLQGFISICIECSNNTQEFLTLSKMVHRLNQFAPLETATDWDNVGLLIEPSDATLIKKILVTNDLTIPVLEEAIEKKVDMIISYHPPITNYPPFTNLKPITRLTHRTWKEIVVLKCIENKIAVYSPHTTWDSINGGMNDWILSVFNTSKVESIQKDKSFEDLTDLNISVKLSLSTMHQVSQEFVEVLKGDKKKYDFRSKNLKLIAVTTFESKNYGITNRLETELEFVANQRGISELTELVEKMYSDYIWLKQDVLESMRIYLSDLNPLMKNVGLGRIGFLKENIKIGDVVEKIKELLNQKTMRLALAVDKSLDNKIGVLAVGAGSGQGLLNNTVADFIITGELNHHDILHEIHRGTSVLITDHSNTERVFFKVFKERFTKLLEENNEQAEIIISEKDRDPLEYI